MSDKDAAAVARRSFLSRLGIGMTGLGAALGSGSLAAQGSAQASPPSPRWQPARHAQDDWFDQVPGQHRFVFDTTTYEGLGGAMFFATNFFVGNQNGYSLGNADLAVVLVLRHMSTVFAYNDAVWAKYGTLLAQRGNLTDPATKQAPKINLFYNASTVPLPNNGTTLDSLLKRGVQLAVCQMATRRVAGAIAEATKVTADAAYNEIVANLVPNSHMVPAGIVAVSRAQERGYTFANVGVQG
jgi:intracellular sulfur oxidation DsrE/DsrF family protein